MESLDKNMQIKNYEEYNFNSCDNLPAQRI